MDVHHEHGKLVHGHWEVHQAILLRGAGLSVDRGHAEEFYKQFLKNAAQKGFVWRQRGKPGRG